VNMKITVFWNVTSFKLYGITSQETVISESLNKPKINWWHQYKKHNMSKTLVTGDHKHQGNTTLRYTCSSPILYLYIIHNMTITLNFFIMKVKCFLVPFFVT
jgi:hypothetical protein